MEELEAIIKEIREIAKQFDEIECVKLFGSRARGEHNKLSDIDLAIFGKQVSLNEFIYELETRVATLLQFDLSDMNQVDDTLFINQVEKEGIIIYEKH